MFRGTLILLCLAFLTSALQSDEPKGKKLGLPLVTWKGRLSNVEKERIERVSSKKEWLALLTAHELGRKRLFTDDPFVQIELDFNAVMAIAVFHGTSGNVQRLDIESFKDEPKRLLIRLKLMTGDHVNIEGPPKDTDTTPWTIAVLPRTDKEILIERGDANARRWHPWAVLPARALDNARP